MGANLYLSVCLLLSMGLHAQKNEPNERPDSLPPAVTVADVEQNAKEAAQRRKDYYNITGAAPQEHSSPIANKKQENAQNDATPVVTNTTVKASKKPEKQ